MQVNVVCRTTICISNGLVTMLTDPMGLIVCGHCGNEITDKTEISDTPAEPTAESIPEPLADPDAEPLTFS